MKLKDGFITHQFDDTQVLVGTENVDFKGIVNSNATAGFVVDCLKNETTREDIVDRMLAKYDAPKDIIEEDVDMVLGKLRSIGAIYE